MTGVTKTHNLIATNILLSLKVKLRNSGCKIYVSDVKVHVKSSNSFYYPDVVVECETSSKNEVFTETPVLIFEVLSKSTASIDRREKRLAYQSIDTLNAYVIVHQTRKQLEIYRRIDGMWTFEEMKSDTTPILVYRADLNLRLSLDEIYEDIEFNSASHLTVQEEADVYSW